MELNVKMKELGLTKRKLTHLKDYETEYFTFSRKIAISALCYLIDNAEYSIKIYHKAISDNKENINNNLVIKSLKNKTNLKIEYHGLFNEKQEDLIKKCIGNHVDVINVITNASTYHHKEMIIDDKYFIITTLNFLTNNIVDDINDNSFWLENFSIWVKRSVK